jgi:hypothetical protein
VVGGLCVVPGEGGGCDRCGIQVRRSAFAVRVVAARNAANGTGVFRAYPVSDYAPQVGDIIQNNRGHVSYTFQYAKTHKSYPSHSAIVVEEGADGSGRYVRTIGGNEGNKVGQRIVRLNARGFIRPPASAPKYYISVIQTLK